MNSRICSAKGPISPGAAIRSPTRWSAPAVEFFAMICNGRREGAPHANLAAWLARMQDLPSLRATTSERVYGKMVECSFRPRERGRGLSRVRNCGTCRQSVENCSEFSVSPRRFCWDRIIFHRVISRFSGDSNRAGRTPCCFGQQGPDSSRPHGSLQPHVARCQTKPCGPRYLSVPVKAPTMAEIKIKPIKDRNLE